MPGSLQLCSIHIYQQPLFEIPTLLKTQLLHLLFLRVVHILAIGKQADDSTVRNPVCGDVSFCFCFVEKVNSAFCKIFRDYYLNN